MTPERLQEIRIEARKSDVCFSHGCRVVQHEGERAVLDRADLLDYVDELTRQLEDARTKAIDAGIFTSTDGDQSRYTHALNTDTCEVCGWDLDAGEYCARCDTGTSTPGATSYKP